MSGDGGSMVVVGYALVAAGAADLLVAVMLLLTEKPADRRTRLVMAAALGFAGAAMIAVGALLWLGVIGGGGE